MPPTAPGRARPELALTGWLAYAFGRTGKIQSEIPARIKAEDPVEIRQYFPRYQNDKRGVIQEITISLETRVRQSLAELRGLPAAREGM